MTDDARSLLHRWFVQYNPLYLASAALVLGGATLVSREAARAASVAGQLGVAAVIEVYALALIGGAAFLFRRGQRRAAVMLGLLVVAFQGDLTLHVETCAYLGGIGLVAAALWWALFVVKLRLLAGALALRLTRGALLVPSVGALFVAGMPRLLRACDSGARGLFVAGAVFAVGVLATQLEGRVFSRSGYDVRGQRCLTGARLALVWLGLAHAAYWVSSFRVAPLALVAGLALAGVGAVRTTRSAWFLAGVAVVIGLAAGSDARVALGLLAALALVVRAVRGPRFEQVLPTDETPPYRDRVQTPARVRRTLGLAPLDDRARLLTGAGIAAVVALGGVVWLPALAVVATALAAVVARTTRRIWVVGPALVFDGYVGWIEGVVELPREPLTLGLIAIGAGFAMLAAGLVIGGRLARRPVERDDQGEDPRPDLRRSSPGLMDGAW